VPEPLVPLTPEWWLNRLYTNLQKQRNEAEFFDAYYRGDHPLPWLAPRARDEFKRMVQMTRSNYMGLVCDATAERLSVEGFRFGQATEADQETWRLWQGNDLDSTGNVAWLEALIAGKAFFLVAPNPAEPTMPDIWVETATQAVVEPEPGTNRRRRAAGFKVWDDDWTGNIHATLYLPGYILKYEAPRPEVGIPLTAGGHPRWVERVVAGEQPNGQRRNPLGVVPLIEIPNNPRLLTGGISELYDLTDSQDRANLTLFHRLETQEYGVDPQKWATAFPETDADGNPQVLEFGRNRILSTDIAETRFGQWASAPLAPLIDAKREDVKDIASRSRTPAQYLLGEMTNVNGETLKASESGLIAKVKQRRRSFGEAAEEAMRLARAIAGLSSDVDDRMETIWTNPEFRTEGELVDAVVKKLASGVTSLRQAREDVGYTQTQILALEADDLANPRPVAPAPPANGAAPAPPGPRPTPPPP
jgi:hypothetical protein